MGEFLGDLLELAGMAVLTLILVGAAAWAWQVLTGGV